MTKWIAGRTKPGEEGVGMGKQQKLKQARRQARKRLSLPLAQTCYLCLKPFQEGEQVKRLVISSRRNLFIDLCMPCACEFLEG
jgi:hypothetical protein